MSNKPRVHAELIKAWADGAVIQFRNLTGDWVDVTEEESPAWFPSRCYRIKPQPKPDVIREYYINTDGRCFGAVLVDANLRLVLDGETGALKSAEVIK